MLCAYQPAWESLPELRDWLQPDPSSTSRARCSLCPRRLNANLTQLRRHAAAVHAAGVPPPPRQRRYNPAWRRLPELSSWLRRSPHNAAAAFCLACNKELLPALGHLRRHATCALHLRRSRRPESARPGAGTAAPASAADTAAAAATADGREGSGDVAAWQRMKAFAPWLRRSAADPRKAFCLFCYKEMTAKMTHVRRHAACARHARCARAAGTAPADAAETAPTGPSVAVSSPPDLDTVSACDSDPEWTPDGREDCEPAAEAALHEFTPVLLPRVDVVFSPSPSPEPDTKPAASQGTKTVDYAAYNANWEQHPDLAGWLAPCPDRPRRAFCTVCRCEITPKLAHVRRHGASLRHRRAAEGASPDGRREKSAGKARGPAGRARQQLVVVVQSSDDVCGDGMGDAARPAGEEDAASEVWPLAEDGGGPDAEEEGRVSAAGRQVSACGLRRRLVFQPGWQQVPELRTWLGRSPWDAQRPFCRFCRREVTAKLAHLRRHATSGLHRRNQRLTEAESEQEGSIPPENGAAGAENGTEEIVPGLCQPAELGPFGSCLVCKHPLVVRLNIFRTRTQTSGRLVSSLLSRLVQRPFREETCEPTSSEICTSCATLLDTADELQAKLAAVESEVRLKFRVPYPLPAREIGSPRSPAAPHPPDGTDDQSQTVAQGVATESQQGDTVLDGVPMAYITIGDPDQEGSTVMVRTERLQDGNLVVFREPVQVNQPDLTADVFCDTLTGTEGPQEEVTEQAASEPQPLWPEPSLKRASQRRRQCRPARGRSPDPGRLGERRHFDCVFCHCSFRTSLALHRHWNTEHPLKLRPCPYCPKRYLHGSSLKQHIRTHEQRGFTCEDCGRQFTANCDLKKHRLFRHSAVRRFPCTDCTTAFKLKWMLARHRRLVHGEC